MILENHKILALDQSLASTAYTIIDTNSELSSFGKVINTKTTKHIEAMRNVRDEIKKIILENDIKLVVLEDTYCGVNNITYKHLSQLLAVLELLCLDLGIKCKAVPAVTWKSKVGINTRNKRPEQKKQSLEIANRIYNLELKDDDVSDSILIGTYAINNITDLI